MEVAKKVKKDTKKQSAKKAVSKAKKSAKAKSKKSLNEPFDDGIVIVDEDIEIDREKVNEERRAYLEEARSQEASD